MSPTAQRQAAAAKGRRVRHERRLIRQRLGLMPRPGGLLEAAALLLTPPAELCGLPVGRFLEWPYRTGPVFARSVLRGCGIGELREIGQLTLRQRDLVATVLCERAAGWKPARQIAASSRSLPSSAPTRPPCPALAPAGGTWGPPAPARSAPTARRQPAGRSVVSA